MISTTPIDETFQAYSVMLAEPFAGLDQDVTEENIQARIRGNILMALSNKLGWLVLTTGNKSEMGVRITPRAFGKDRRLPITNHYRDARP